jgi:hypothetical protein
MPRLTADQWAAIRIEWEGEPSATFLGLAEKHGVAVSSISRTAARHGWSKRGVIGDINEAAQRKADARVDADGNAKQPQRQSTAGDLATRTESEDVRAAVLERLRREWAELEAFRKAALVVMKAAHEGTGEWKNAKLAADTALANMRALEVKQAGERKAWGLDQTAEAEIVISNPRGAMSEG